MIPPPYRALSPQLGLPLSLIMQRFTVAVADPEKLPSLKIPLPALRKSPLSHPATLLLRVELMMDKTALPFSPSLMIAPPSKPAELPLKVQPVTCNVAL